MRLRSPVLLTLIGWLLASLTARAVVSPFAADVAATLSVADAGGRLEVNRRGVTTMTSAISASASSVRLSMQVVELP